jgi:hypothetical protein
LPFDTKANKRGHGTAVQCPLLGAS